MVKTDGIKQYVCSIWNGDRGLIAGLVGYSECSIDSALFRDNKDLVCALVASCRVDPSVRTGGLSLY